MDADELLKNVLVELKYIQTTKNRWISLQKKIGVRTIRTLRLWFMQIYERHVTLVTNLFISHEWRKDGLWLPQIEHIRGHMLHIYSVTVNQVSMATVKLSKLWLEEELEDTKGVVIRGTKS